MRATNRIFISYSWRNFSIVDELEENLHRIGIQTKRDVRDLNKNSSIKEYMKTIRKSDYIIVCLSDSFLRSKNCMYEIMELLKDEDYQSRTVPIILSDFDAFDIKSKLQYISYWNNCKREIETEMREIDIESLGSLTDDLRMLRNITNTIGDFMSYIQDTNCLKYCELKETNYEALLKLLNFDNTYLEKQIIRIHQIAGWEQRDYEIDEFLESNPGYFRAHLLKAANEMIKKYYKKAMRHFDLAISISPNEPDGYHCRVCFFWN